MYNKPRPQSIPIRTAASMALIKAFEPNMRTIDTDFSKLELFYYASIVEIGATADKKDIFDRLYTRKRG